MLQKQIRGAAEAISVSSMVTQEFIVMASSIKNMPLNVGTIKGLDCLSHGKFNLNTLLIRPSISSLPQRRLLVVKASTSDGHIKKLGMSDAECEAVVVAGNVPETPSVPPIPASPAGTPAASFVKKTHRLASCLVDIGLDGDIGLLEEVDKARDVGGNSIVLFPKVPDALKALFDVIEFLSVYEIDLASASKINELLDELSVLLASERASICRNNTTKL